MPATWKRIITTADDSNYKNSNVNTFSGNYNDLSNKPTIPTNNNQLTNGAGYTTNVGDITGVTAGTGLTGGGTSGGVTISIANQGVGTNQIAQEAIIADHIEDEAIEDNHMAEESVGSSALVPGAVTSAKIASNAVTSAKIATSAVTYQKFSVNQSPTSGQYLQAQGGGTGMGWATIAINNSNWNGTDLSVANGGTGASSASTARGKNNLDVNQAGHLGYSDRIKVMPADFMPDSDNSTANYAITSAHNGGSGRVMSSYLEAFASYNIPSGFKATSCVLYASTNIGFAVYENSITSSTASSKGTGTATSSGGLCNFTDITASTTNYMSIRLDFSSTTHYFYGGYISITRV